MNQVVAEMKAILDGTAELMHYGMPRRSGRYPYGSGEDPYQHGRDFLGRVQEMKKSGMSEADIAKELGLVNEKGVPSSSRLRTEISIAKEERRMLQVARAKELQSKNLGPTAIGKEMGIPESTVRSLLNPVSESRMHAAQNTANRIRELIETKGMIDVGASAALELGVSQEKLKTALYLLEREGYPIYKGGIPQATNPGQQTNQKVICPKGTQHKEIYEFDRVHAINEDGYVSTDNGVTFRKFQYPTSVDSKRVKILLADEVGPDGTKGVDKDGIIELRRGVPDLSLGTSRYAQVRILVDGNKYLKGMAVYSDNLPDGVDILFNSNKSSVEKAYKPIKDDPDNPFGSLIKPNGQSTYIDKDGKEKLSAINKPREEGDWDEWADALPSQFLSKQSLSLAKKQLGIAKADKQSEFDDICALTNPTIKKHMLQKFSDECDSAAVHLKAAALPGQKYHVIIPINTLKDNEVYAPNYEDGTKLALIRYPHGGTFEIPILTVNNKHAPAKKLLGKDIVDAVGINKKIAEQLSGADFDGDTVMCIPTHDRGGKVKISSRPPLKGLEGFDPTAEYGPDTYAGRDIKLMTKKGTQTQMGIVSNLITDMTLGGANDDELARAVRHSMVVIDAHKHKLNYKQSEIDNNIDALRKKYQVQVKEDGTIKYGGASTIISRAKGETNVVKRQGTPKVNMKGKEWYDPSKPEGALIYKDADDAWYTYQKTNKRTGEVVEVTDYKKQRSTKMAEAQDARDLVSVSKHPMEMLYADYANSMKSLANEARKEMMTTGKIEYSASAKKAYQNEVSSLMSKLNNALKNSVRERAAQRKANAEVQAKVKADPNLDKSDIKKLNQQAITKYRAQVGAVSRRERNIDITDKEWEAIQAGAISENYLKKILDNTDIDVLRERATPRTSKSLSNSQINRIRAMSNSYTLEQLASKFNVSPSTISKYLKGES